MIKNNKYILLSKHKIKQALTPLYDSAKSLRASMPDYHYDFWHNIRDKLDRKTYDAIHVANVNMCNAKCVFCGQHRFERAKHIMSEDTFNNILAGAKDLGTIKEIDFTPPLGEPLLDPHIFDKADNALIEGYKTSITTNGIKLADGLYERVALHFNEVRISIGGLDYDSYYKTYGVNKFSNVFVGLIALLEYIKRFSADTDCKVKLMFRSAMSEWKLIHTSYFKELQPFIDKGILSVEFTNYYDNWGGSVKPNDLIGVMKPRTVKKKCGIPCFSLDTFFIEHQGNVRMCGCRFLNKEDDGLVVGNINKTPLKEILAPANLYPLYNRFFDKDKDNSPDVCQNCTLYRPM